MLWILGLLCKILGILSSHPERWMLGHYLMGSGKPVRLDYSLTMPARESKFLDCNIFFWPKDELGTEWYERWYDTRMKNCVGKVMVVSKNVTKDVLEWADLYQFYPTCDAISYHVAGCSCPPESKTWNEACLWAGKAMPQWVRKVLYKLSYSTPSVGGWDEYKRKGAIARIARRIYEGENKWSWHDLKIDVCGNELTIHAKDRFFEPLGVPFFMYGNATFSSQKGLTKGGVETHKCKVVINKCIPFRWLHKNLIW